MGDFELIFEVCPLKDGQIDALYAHEDAVLSTHGRTTLVTMTSNGSSALGAAKVAVGRLESLGVTVCRLYEDFVTRAEVARRAAVTPQAVGQWVRNERRAADAPPFPEPCNFAGSSELWLWSDVNDWLAHLGKGDGLRHPTRVDYVFVNEWLLARASELRVRHLANVVVSARFSQAAMPFKATRRPAQHVGFGLAGR